MLKCRENRAVKGILILLLITIAGIIGSLSGTAQTLLPTQSDMDTPVGGTNVKNIATYDPDVLKYRQLDSLHSKMTREMLNMKGNFLPTDYPKYDLKVYDTAFNDRTITWDDDLLTAPAILLKNAFQYAGEWYDIKYTIKQINNNFAIATHIDAVHRPDYVSFSADSPTRRDWGEARFDIQILDKQGKEAKIPNIVIGLNDLDNVYYPREVIQMPKNYKITKENTIIGPNDPGVNIKGNSVFGNSDLDTNRPVYFKNTGLENGHISDIWLGLPKGLGESTSGCWSGFNIAIPQLKVSYVADKGGKISGITKEDVDQGEFIKSTEVNPNSQYKFTHWTANKTVTLNGKTLTVGTEISNDDMTKLRVFENTTFKAHFEKKTGGIKINKSFK